MKQKPNVKFGDPNVVIPPALTPEVSDLQTGVIDQQNPAAGNQVE